MSVPGESVESLRMEVGFVAVEAVIGNIVNESTDAIVNSTSNAMDLTGQVSKALLSKGGNKILSDCQARGTIGDSGVFAASAQGTTLQCKYLMHVDIQKPAANLVKACFNEADRLKMRSIALPVLGTGNHNADPKKIIPVLVNGVREYLCLPAPSHLRLIRFVVFQPSMMEILKQEMISALGRPAVQGREEPLGMEVSHSLPESAMLPSASACESFSFDVSLSTFTDNRMNELKQFCSLHGVHVRFDKQSRHVTLMCSDPTARNTVHKYIEKFSDDLQAQEALQRKVQWQFWKDGEEWINYSQALNIKIENARRTGQNTLTYASGRGSFVVDLQRNIDHLKNNEEISAKIRRVDRLAAQP